MTFHLRGSGLGAVEVQASAAGGAFDDVCVDTESDEDAPPAAFADDIYEGMEENRIPNVDHDQDGAGDDDHDQDGAGDVVGAPSAEVEGVVRALLEAEPTLPEGEEPEPSMEDGVRSASMDEDGYVSSNLMPWSAKGSVGRITVWPRREGILPSQQNVGARCYMHTKCSFGRKRHRATNDKILRWLFSAKPDVPGATAEEKAAAKAKHARQAVSML